MTAREVKTTPAKGKRGKKAKAEVAEGANGEEAEAEVKEEVEAKPKRGGKKVKAQEAEIEA